MSTPETARVAERFGEHNASAFKMLAAKLEGERDAARRELVETKRDKVRLDYLDYLNRCLNARSGTLYGWVLTLSHNVRRLAVDFPYGIDLNDQQAVGCHPTGRMSVRSAIDSRMREVGEEEHRDAQRAVDGMLATDMLEHAKKWEWSGDLMRCRECSRAIHYVNRNEALKHADGCKTHMAYPWVMFEAAASNT